MSSSGEALKQALKVIEAQKAWIYAVPLDTPLPAMPGFDREWADGVELALKDAIGEDEAQGDASPAGDRSQKCWCETCRPITLDDMRMVLCPTCGNKRCPHATDHRHACTNSNEPGQTGSSYCATFNKSAQSLGIPACGGPLCNEHNHHPL